jgi:hypothetical protein
LWTVTRLATTTPPPLGIALVPAPLVPIRLPMTWLPIASGSEAVEITTPE